MTLREMNQFIFWAEKAQRVLSHLETLTPDDPKIKNAAAMKKTCWKAFLKITTTLGEVRTQRILKG